MKNYFVAIKEKYSCFFLIRLVLFVIFALFILDVNDIPSSIIFKYNSNIILTSSIILTIFGITTFFELKLFNLIFIKSINFIDAALITGIFSTIMYWVIAHQVNILASYKSIIVSIIFMIFTILILFRYFRYTSSVKQDGSYKSNVFDLKDIYEGDFELSKDSIILMGEKDVDYDLLHRESVIERLFEAILLSKPEEKFVISLEGKWGAGKTTILNNVKKKLKNLEEDIVIIDEFDPWCYSDQESLFVNMFDIILNKTGYQYSTRNIKNIINKFSELVFGGNRKWLFMRNFNGNEDVNILKSRINDYLRLSHRKVVFFIDNIDRLNSGNVKLLFNCVANLLDFQHVTYVLSFDNDRVKTIFNDELGLDYQYLKKIIQLQIRVPEVDENIIKNIYLTCLNNILLELGEEKSDMTSYTSLVDNMCKQSIDIRDFKRFVNSVICLSKNKYSSLNKKDILNIEYIRLNNLSLYNIILTKRRFFISHDKQFDRDLYADSFRKEEFSKEAEKFFDELLTNEINSNYKDILIELFPSIDIYIENRTPSGQSDDAEVAKKHNICSAKYFDLYFTNTSNSFLEIGKQTAGLIELFNNDTSYIEIENKYKEILSLLHTTYHKEFFERLMVYLDDIENKDLLNLSILLFDNILSVDDSMAFLQLNAKTRVEVIICEILKQLDEEEFEIFLNRTKSAYSKINVLRSIVNWMEEEDTLFPHPSKNEKLRNSYESIVKDILKNKINLYEDEHYSRKNIFALYRKCETEAEEIRKYMENIVNKDNIFRFLSDIIGTSQGTMYTYSITKKNIDAFIDEEIMNNLLSVTEPKTDDERFVLEVYQKYQDNSNNRFYTRGITTGTERVFVHI